MKNILGDISVAAVKKDTFPYADLVRLFGDEK
jgi:hypothetical protein